MLVVDVYEESVEWEGEDYKESTDHIRHKEVERDEFDPDDPDAIVSWAYDEIDTCVEASCVPYKRGDRVWFTSVDTEQDMRTGVYTRRSYHFKGLTDDEMWQLVNRLKLLTQGE